MLGFFWRIVGDHYKSLPGEVIATCHLFAFIAGVPLFLGFLPTSEQISAVITAVSIYSALLFSILVPASDQGRRIKEQLAGIKDDGLTETKLKKKALEAHRKVASDILTNVAFSIIVSLLCVLSLIVTLCLTPKEGIVQNHSTALWRLASLYVSGYMFVFVFMVLMVVVRTAYGSLQKETSDAAPVSEPR